MENHTPLDPARLSVVLDAYLEALHHSVRAHDAERSHPSGMSFELVPGRRYIKVVMCQNGTQRSVHAFVDARTGDLIKAAGWKAPQKNLAGQLAVRFHLADDVERLELCDRLRNMPHAYSGGYLYA